MVLFDTSKEAVERDSDQTKALASAISSFLCKKEVPDTSREGGS
jgi:hypothetical protein